MVFSAVFTHKDLYDQQKLFNYYFNFLRVSIFLTLYTLTILYSWNVLKTPQTPDENRSFLSHPFRFLAEKFIKIYKT